MRPHRSGRGPYDRDRCDARPKASAGGAFLNSELTKVGQSGPMATALASPLRSAAPAQTRDLRAFLTWLGCWLFLPNLPFLPITLMGGPPRWPETAACGVVALAVHRWSYPLRLAAYLALMT